MTGSSLRRILAIARHDLRILRRDPVFILIFTIMPLGFMAFTKGAFGAAMGVRYPNHALNGAEQVVPGAAVLFSGFLVGNLGFAVFREHAWSTWERLRASHLETWELMLGKSIAPILTLALQLTVMLGLGGFSSSFTPGSVVFFLSVPVSAPFGGIGVRFRSPPSCSAGRSCSTTGRNPQAMLLGGIGGAVTPFYLLPAWAQHIAPATPTYWAMRGFNRVIIGGGGFSSVALPIAALAAFSAGFTIIAALRFGVEEAKLSWA